ncbi:hypothetical protein BH11PSE8_BH11PSE8_05850 [soil metagenome]
MSVQNPATPPLRVLFVEDNDDLREIIGILLEEEGLDVSPCASAEEAESLFAQHPFDIVLTDVSLPKMSGTELAKRLLATAPGTWIVFSTGYSLDRGLEAWGPTVRILPKPFEVEDLQALLGEIRAVQA